MPQLTGIHHVKFPVSDLAASRAWYEQVFGFEVTMEFPDEQGVVRGLAGFAPGLGDVGLALRENPAAAAGIQGFDPVSFGIADKAAAEQWAAHLDTLGIDHSPVIDATIGWILVFHDPDGTEIHLYSFAAHGTDQTGRKGYGRTTTPA
ncbi:VOC family protein [Kutzneria chonburiensis]|uniref:VOC family protein n=1 Tax=Kutzneria chonburiensis TaxID=1483604 RepID=A0ABV6MZD3_9PSEU|nr:VOC family protein [Kutzneria chonburiensis]